MNSGGRILNFHEDEVFLRLPWRWHDQRGRVLGSLKYRIEPQAACAFPG